MTSSYDRTSGYIRFVAHSASCLTSQLGELVGVKSTGCKVKSMRLAVRRSSQVRNTNFAGQPLDYRSNQLVPKPKPREVKEPVHLKQKSVLISYSRDCIASQISFMRLKVHNLHVFLQLTHLEASAAFCSCFAQGAKLPIGLLSAVQPPTRGNICDDL